MPKHIRDNRQRMDQCSHLSGTTDYIKCKATTMYNQFTNQPGMYIRSNPKQTMGTIFVLLLLLVAGLVAAHYMGYITLPAAVGNLIPRKAAPASHLQYFFF